MPCKVAESRQLQKLLTYRWRINHLMFQYPGEFVRNEYGLQPGSERRINVGSRAVSDHPCGGAVATMAGSNFEVGVAMLFG